MSTSAFSSCSHSTGYVAVAILLMFAGLIACYGSDYPAYFDYPNGGYVRNTRRTTELYRQNELNEVYSLLGLSDFADSTLIENAIPQKKTVYKIENNPKNTPNDRTYFLKHLARWKYTIIASTCSVVALVAVIFAAVCYFKMHKAAKQIEQDGLKKNVSGTCNGDKKLAQSAQMYHYQHQKQQMIAQDKINDPYREDPSDEESEPEEAAADYTVYECPGMAAADEMEVQNPMFAADPPSPNGSN